MTMKRHNNRDNAFGIGEAIFALALTAIVVLGILNMVGMAIASSDHTEQTFLAQDLASSQLAEILASPIPWSQPREEHQVVTVRGRDFSVSRQARAHPDEPYCAEVTITVTWRQGRLQRQVQRKALIPLREVFGG